MGDEIRYQANRCRLDRYFVVDVTIKTIVQRCACFFYCIFPKVVPMQRFKKNSFLVSVAMNIGISHRLLVTYK